jgi:hypothetical protein
MIAIVSLLVSWFMDALRKKAPEEVLNSYRGLILVVSGILSS